MKSPLRNIRHKLFNEGKLLRYLGYAVGEIALIIIGIMLALQLNNWNEERKAQVEFEDYIAQLKVDIQRAASNTNNMARDFRQGIANHNALFTFLENPDNNPENMESFESSFKRLGGFAEPQIKIGLLGRLLEGNTDIIKQNQPLTVKALGLESFLEFRLNLLQHIRHRVTNDIITIDKYRGKTVKLLPNIPFRYDLDELKSSNEFIYAAQNLLNKMETYIHFMDEISEGLEDFLVVLEEN